MSPTAAPSSPEVEGASPAATALWQTGGRPAASARPARVRREEADIRPEKADGEVRERRRRAREEAREQERREDRADGSHVRGDAPQVER